MSNFMTAMQSNDSQTENAMPTHSTSGAMLVDMFYRMGASRGLDETNITGMFTNAFGEDSLLALKAMFYNRDVRGGQGERRSFRTMFKYLCVNYPDIAIRNITNVVKYGRWDDLFVAFGTKVEGHVLSHISLALTSEDGLCAKWMPRENKANREIASTIRRFMDLTPKQYRKMLSSLTSVVETQMCGNKWDGIEFSHVPSRAMNIYRDAFKRHNPSGFDAWISAVEKGEATVHSGTLYPYDLVGKFMDTWYGFKTPSGVRVLNEQWKALPNYMPEGKKIFPMIDTSGSMFGGYGDIVSPLVVAISLGLYLSERNVGPFKDSYLTFSESPEFITLKGKTLSDRMTAMETHMNNWGMNTNVMAAFRTMLHRAKIASLSSEDMPDAILILSDMQFDKCGQNPNDNAFDAIRKEYELAGYELPKIVFWNLRATTDKQAPVKFDKQGTALVSGFSPSIMKSVLTGEFMTPERVMLDTLNQERYDSVIL